MIYFDNPTQQKLVRDFWDLLLPGGHLLVGHSESLVANSVGFRYIQPATLGNQVKIIERRVDRGVSCKCNSGLMALKEANNSSPTTLDATIAGLMIISVFGEDRCMCKREESDGQRRI